jgi:hypothetical protein
MGVRKIARRDHAARERRQNVKSKQVRKNLMESGAASLSVPNPWSTNGMVAQLIERLQTLTLGDARLSQLQERRPGNTSVIIRQSGERIAAQPQPSAAMRVSEDCGTFRTIFRGMDGGKCQQQFRTLRREADALMLAASRNAKWRTVFGIESWRK